MQVHTIPLYRALFHKDSFDFVILSVHQVDDREFWTQDFQRGKSQKEYNEKEQAEKIKAGAAQMENSKKIIEYQEIIELMEELVKKIIIRPDGSIHIEWNFCDEIGEVIPFRSNLALEEKTISSGPCSLMRISIGFNS